MLKILSRSILIYFLILPLESFAQNNQLEFSKIQTQQLQSSQIEQGIYIFVSFSMNDSSIRKYFIDGQKYGAKLVLRGLVNEDGKNKFASTKAKLEKVKVNADINPVLFKELDINHVPVIAVIDEDGKIKKITGHILLDKALELMEIDQKLYLKKLDNKA